jgi:hypothetical protein
MSNPDNGAARNTMNEFERQCYDWGWEDAKERIIELLKDNSKCALDKGHDTKGYCFCEAVTIIKNFGE